MKKLLLLTILLTSIAIKNSFAMEQESLESNLQHYQTTFYNETINFYRTNKFNNIQNFLMQKFIEKLTDLLNKYTTQEPQDLATALLSAITDVLSGANNSKYTFLNLTEFQEYIKATFSQDANIGQLEIFENEQHQTSLRFSLIATDPISSFYKQLRATLEIQLTTKKINIEFNEAFIRNNLKKLNDNPQFKLAISFNRVLFNAARRENPSFASAAPRPNNGASANAAPYAPRQARIIELPDDLDTKSPIRKTTKNSNITPWYKKRAFTYTLPIIGATSLNALRILLAGTPEGIASALLATTLTATACAIPTTALNEIPRISYKIYKKFSRKKS